MANTRIQIRGVSEVMRNLGVEGAQILRQEVDEVVERTVRTMANEAAINAPVLSGKLSASIPPSVEQVADMSWQFGSDVEYATRQEYEHSTKKGFIRKAVWDNIDSLRTDIAEVLERHGS